MGGGRNASASASRIVNALNWTPLGIPQGMYDAGQMIGGGAQKVPQDPVGGFRQMNAGVAMAGLGMLPGGDEAAAPIERALESTAARTPTRGILATPDLRQMNLSDAMDVASNEPHLIQDKSGQYIGAPRGVTTRRQITSMRKKFDADVALGAPGSQWYTGAAEENKVYAGPDPAKQRLLAQEQAAWSPQASPDPNFNWAIQAHNAYEMGQPLDLVHTGAQAQRYNQARAAGTDIPLGPKTEVYGVNLDPTREPSTTGTNDIWHARGFGYTGGRKNDSGVFDRALTDQEHRFLDYETVLATKHANDKALGGRTDWTAPQVQAAAWVAGKGRSLAEDRFGGDLQRGIAEAAKTYPDYAPKYTAFGTHEQTPAADIGHLPGLLTGTPEARSIFAGDPLSSWTGNTAGRDSIYDALGLYQRPTLPATGIYEPPSGALETNPAQIARPLVGMQASGAGVDPISQQALNAAESSRAYVDAQGAGAWHKLITNAKPGDMGSVHVPLSGPLPPDKVAPLKALGAQYGLPDILDSGTGVTLHNFNGTPGGAAAGKALKAQGGLRDQLVGLLGGGEPMRVKVESNLLPMFHPRDANFNALPIPAPGSGDVTKSFLQQVSALPQQVQERLAAGLKGKAYANMQRDAALGAATGQPVRADIQNARQILSQPGNTIEALRQALASGKIALPSIAGGALGLGALWGLTSPQQQQQPGRVY